MSDKSYLERLMRDNLKSLGISFMEEYRFDSYRRWRFDFAIPEYQIAIECEGGIWSRGRHTRGRGFISDCEKYNRATVLGWKVLRYTPDNIAQVYEDLRQIMKGDDVIC